MMNLTVVCDNPKMCNNPLDRPSTEYRNVQQIVFHTAKELKDMGYDVGTHKGKDMFFTLDIVLPDGNVQHSTFSCSDYLITSYDE